MVAIRLKILKQIFSNISAMAIRSNKTFANLGDNSSADSLDIVRSIVDDGRMNVMIILQPQNG